MLFKSIHTKFSLSLSFSTLTIYEWRKHISNYFKYHWWVKKTETNVRNKRKWWKICTRLWLCLKIKTDETGAPALDDKLNTVRLVSLVILVFGFYCNKYHIAILLNKNINARVNPRQLSITKLPHRIGKMINSMDQVRLNKFHLRYPQTMTKRNGVSDGQMQMYEIWVWGG